MKGPRRLSASVLLLLLLAAISCSSGGGGSSLPLTTEKGPYVQDVTQTEATICWQTLGGTSIATVQYGETTSYGSTVQQAANNTTRVQEVRLTGLSPDTLYYYRVTSDDRSSAGYSFRTAPPAGTPFRFCVYGDNRTDYQQHQVVVDAIISSSPSFVVNMGDVVANGNNYSEWNEQFFTPARELMHNVPVWVAIGNHENNAQYFYDYFSFPGDEYRYTFSWGNAYFVVFDTNKDYSAGSEGLTWLQTQLPAAEAQAADWLFFCCHHPAWTRGWDDSWFVNPYDGEDAMRTTIIPLLETYGVDAMFCGHTHDYERGRRNGVYYIISGGGGAPLDSEKNQGEDFYWLNAYYEYHQITVVVDGLRLVAEARKPDGTLLDMVVMDKNPALTLWSDNFDDGNLDAQEWSVIETVEQAGGVRDGGWWAGTGGNPNVDAYLLGPDPFAYVDSDWYTDESGNRGIEVNLISIPIDCTGYTRVLLNLDYYYDHYTTLPRYSRGIVFYSTDGGGNWTELKRFENADDVSAESFTIDLPQAAGQPDVRIRFYYWGDNDNWFMIDNVSVTGY